MCKLTWWATRSPSWLSSSLNHKLSCFPQLFDLFLLVHFSSRGAVFHNFLRASYTRRRLCLLGKSTSASRTDLMESNPLCLSLCPNFKTNPSKAGLAMPYSPAPLKHHLDFHDESVFVHWIPLHTAGWCWCQVNKDVTKMPSNVLRQYVFYHSTGEIYVGDLKARRNTVDRCLVDTSKGELPFLEQCNEAIRKGLSMHWDFRQVRFLNNSERTNI